jgi:hypothetical protein
MTLTLELSSQEIKILEEHTQKSLAETNEVLSLYRLSRNSKKTMQHALIASVLRKLLAGLDVADVDRNRREIKSIDDIQL